MEKLKIKAVKGKLFKFVLISFSICSYITYMQCSGDVFAVELKKLKIGESQKTSQKRGLVQRKGVGSRREEDSDELDDDLEELSSSKNEDDDFNDEEDGDALDVEGVADKPLDETFDEYDLKDVKGIEDEEDLDEEESFTKKGIRNKKNKIKKLAKGDLSNKKKGKVKKNKKDAAKIKKESNDSDVELPVTVPEDKLPVAMPWTCYSRRDVIGETPAAAGDSIAFKYYKEAGLLKNDADKDMVLIYRDVDSENKTAYGSVMQEGCLYFSPTYLRQKYSVDANEDFSNISVEITGGGNSYIANCKQGSKFIRGPYPIGDFMAIKICIGLTDYDVNGNVSVPEGFRLNPNFDYTVKLYSGEYINSGADSKSKDDNGAVDSTSKDNNGAADANNTDKVGGVAKTSAKLMAAIPVRPIVSADYVEPFGVDGGLAYSQKGTSLLQSFNHPRMFDYEFYSSVYKTSTNANLKAGL